jgi:hypothetical protein
MAVDCAWHWAVDFITPAYAVLGVPLRAGGLFFTLRPASARKE